MDTNKILVFERPPISRLISCAASFGSAALFFTYLAENADDLHAAPIVGLILLFLGTVAAAVVQYGDHIYLSDQGLMYENKLHGTVSCLVGAPRPGLKNYAETLAAMNEG